MSRQTAEQGLPELERAIIEHDNPIVNGPLIILDEAAAVLDRVVKSGRVSRYSDVLAALRREFEFEGSQGLSNGQDA